MIKLIITIIAVISSIVCCVVMWTEHKEKLRYRDAALKNGRARLQRDEEHRDEIGQINRRAAKRIADQNATIEDLMAQIRLLEMINRNYKKQLERSKS